MKFPKNADLWLPAYLKDRARNLTRRPAKRLWVAITDHFEPHGNTTLDVAHQRMAVWQDRWPTIAANAPKDALGKPPVFTAFYPQEEYQVDLLNAIAGLCKDGTMDVEVHLHHDNDHADSFREKVQTFITRLRNDHGLLHDHNGRMVFGFIHGNWALDNSRPDGRWCGVHGELQILRDLGCYADFTMPSLPSPTQSRILNQIYWTTGDAAKPRGFDHGIEATVGGGKQGDLLMITGPTGLRYKGRLMPRLETGELACYDSPSAYRVDRWLALAPRLGDDIFLKLYGHTAREDNAASLLGSGSTEGKFATLFRHIHEGAQKHNLELHWSSAFDMFKAVDNLIQPQGQTR